MPPLPLFDLLELAAVLSGLVGFAWMVLVVRKELEGWRVQRRLRRGVEGQRAARDFLEQQGFEILAEEHSASSEVEVDGQRHAFDVRIDFLARRRSKLFGVEVKTGERAVDPVCRATRRQLLEYSQIFPLDGLFLLDMETPRLMRVQFPAVARGPRWRWPLVLGLGFVLGVAAVILLGS
jgi:hypothetical protein